MRRDGRLYAAQATRGSRRRPWTGCDVGLPVDAAIDRLDSGSAARDADAAGLRRQPLAGDGGFLFLEGLLRDDAAWLLGVCGSAGLVIV